MAQAVASFPHGRHQFILNSQYYGCWSPGEARNQMCCHVIDLILAKYNFIINRKGLPYNPPLTLEMTGFGDVLRCVQCRTISKTCINCFMISFSCFLVQKNAKRWFEKYCYGYVVLYFQSFCIIDVNVIWIKCISILYTSWVALQEHARILYHFSTLSLCN